tara:strand:- start:1298 stop:2584 length:1287 start_codon:yes stop_codon:yes gene_type:complete
MFIIKILIILFSSIFLFSQDPELLLNQGDSALLSGDIDNAESLFNKSLKADPSFAPALQALSKLSLYKGDLKKANEYSIQAVQADEDFREWSNKIIKIKDEMLRAKKSSTSEESIAIYESIIKQHSYYSDAYFYIGYNHYKNKDIKTASMNFSKALAIYPNHKNAKTMLSNITKKLLNNGNKSYKRGDLTKATSYYEQALEYDSNFYLAHFQLGVLQKKQGQSEVAIESLKKVLDIKPDHDKTWFTLGTVFESEGDIDLSLEHYKKAIDINPTYSKPYASLGKIYTDMKDYENAEDILKRVVQIDSEYPEGFMRLGFLYIEQEKYDDALENLKRSIELDDGDYMKFFKLASVYNNLEKWNLAAQSAQSCIDLKKKFGGGWLELGLAELGRKKSTRAKRHFEEARKDRDWRKMAERKIDEINNPSKYEK